MEHPRRRIARVHDQHNRSTAIARFNATIAVAVTKSVGSMWCAYAFCLLALSGLPAALQPGGVGFANWLAEEFIQLVLLSVIMVGQDVQAKAADKRAADTYADTELLLAKLDQLLQGQSVIKRELD